MRDSVLSLGNDDMASQEITRGKENGKENTGIRLEGAN